jgi:hypothetical protein
MKCAATSGLKEKMDNFEIDMRLKRKNERRLMLKFVKFGIPQDFNLKNYYKDIN